MQNIFEASQFLLAPFLMCLILAGIHCYLGLHVLGRGVIFVDLSLAQVAAMGTVLGVSLGMGDHSFGTYILSLCCTFLAAIFFAYARKQEKSFSQEAIIGVVYVLASSLVVLILDKTTHSAEHLKTMLVGQILWVTWKDVIVMGFIYSVVGLIHYIFRKQFIRSSFEKDHASIFWDFLFYGLFGVIITSSVRVVGVLQVFAYLVVPAMVATAFFKTIRARLIFGWILGFFLSLVGLILSYMFDLPTGATIISCFAVVPVLVLIQASMFRLNR